MSIGTNGRKVTPFRPNPPNPLGRHPFNIITEEVLGD
jgi:hypothetical protein